MSDFIAPLPLHRIFGNNLMEKGLYSQFVSGVPNLLSHKYDRNTTDSRQISEFIKWLDYWLDWKGLSKLMKRNLYKRFD